MNAPKELLAARRISKKKRLPRNEKEIDREIGR